MNENERAETAWHTQSIEKVYDRLDTRADGLRAEEARSRSETYGPNRLPEGRRRGSIDIALDQIKDPLIYILIAAGAIAVALGDFIDAAVIFGVVALNGVIGFTQEARAEAEILALRKMLARKALAVRDNSELEIDAEELVPGDIVLLQAGDKVPADVRLIKVKYLQIDESMFTGESVPARKESDPLAEPDLGIDEQTNMAYMGSGVAAGRGRGLVVATGARTELGRVSAEVGAAGRVKTPLENRMETLSRIILLVVMIFGAFGFIVGTLRGDDLVVLFLTLVALAVAAVPEGLPVAMTIALAAAVNRMAKQNAIIRHLPAIETLGSCTTIGSDKTGTLTSNEMTVRRVWAGGALYSVGGQGYTPEGGITEDDREAEIVYPLAWTLRAGLLCNESRLVRKEDRWTAAGDPTEVALIVSARKAGLNEESEGQTYAQLDLLPFESEAQYMATLNTSNGQKYLLVKGSPEAVLSRSNDLESGDEPFDAQALQKQANKLAGQGLRVLAMAYREMPAETAEIIHDDVENLTFLGLQGMLDPPRPEAIEAVNKCRKSGIRVVMITGDNELTGLSIARRMGIAGPDADVLTGKEIDRMNKRDLEREVKKVPVYARVSPEHKLRIVQALIANGHIVAVTGDGVNDAPALKASHIGVAMGITGTDVAKETSDMVIVDDNFASLYQSIINGRVAFDNLRKVTFFLLSSGLGALLAVAANLFTRLPLILLPAQILWFNLVTNGLQDVALAFDPPEPGVAERPPRPPNEGILNRILIVRLVLIGTTIGIVSFGIFVFSLDAGESKARTIALSTIVFAQFFNVLNARSERLSVFQESPFKNRFLSYSMIAALLAQLSIIYVDFMRRIFRTTTLNGAEWLIIIGLGATALVVSELDKLRLRRRDAKRAAIEDPN